MKKNIKCSYFKRWIEVLAQNQRGVKWCARFSDRFVMDVVYKACFAVGLFYSTFRQLLAKGPVIEVYWVWTVAPLNRILLINSNSKWEIFDGLAIFDGLRQLCGCLAIFDGLRPLCGCLAIFDGLLISLFQIRIRLTGTLYITNNFSIDVLRCTIFYRFWTFLVILVDILTFLYKRTD